MELQRIVARDHRSAMERAIALYGKELLMVSSQEVDGQTELVVAIDKARPLPTSGRANAPQSGGPVLAGLGRSPTATSSAGRAAFEEAMELVRHVAPAFEPAPAPEAVVAATEPPPEVTADAPPGDTTPPQPAASPESVRGQEMVDLICREIAALRQEFQVGMQVRHWQHTQGLSAELIPLAESLESLGIPAAMRALLLDGARRCETLEAARHSIRRQLQDALPSESSMQGLLSGRIAVCGPTGAGKSLMAARLALVATQTLPAEQVALVSYNDQRSGAWSQMRIMALQVGVDCFQANDLEQLQLLLEDQAGRRLVVIDTPGLDCIGQAEQLAASGLGIALHALLPADASYAQVRRLWQVRTLWAGVLISKLDESEHPWPLVQALCEQPLPVRAISRGNRLQAGTIGDFQPLALVDSAINGLEPVTAVPGLTVHSVPEHA
jgi:flagellar biosynthesis protein FlhF